MAMRHVPPVDYDELVADYKAGWTIKELAVRTGWSHRTIRALLEERGVMVTAPKASHSVERPPPVDESALKEALQANARAELARREHRANLAEQKRKMREIELRRTRELEAARQRHLERVRIDSSARWYTRTRDAIAARRAEVEFERQEQANLAQWLREYGDILG